ncbi:MAG: histidinol-phosphate transaminase [Defluviitaleaceae bacterium]|nr:histidinol-phosphate transaminase [Defluviitaleaceae bacterium]
MNYLSTKAKALTPYVAGLQPQEPGWIKLNTNENPYPPSPKVVDAIKNADISSLGLYPDGDSTALKEAIAADLGLAPDNIFCGNGSDEVLALAYQAFFSGKDNVLTPDISYGFYPVWGSMYDVGLKTVPVDEDFSVNPDDYRDAKGVVIANPNAPTSLALNLGQVELILRQNPNGVVLIDEAYIDFAKVESAVALLGMYENLLVVRTFSKSHSLAGMRIGYAIGQPKLIEALRLVRDSFNSYPLDMLAQTAAIAAIKDKAYLMETIAGVKDIRDKTIPRLQEMGYHVMPSQTNFLLIKTPAAGELYNHFLGNKILARYWNKPRLNDCLRVTIGTREDMEVFLQCVQAIALATRKKQR